MTIIIRCDCKNESQDKLHGKQMRAANKMNNGQYRCTVCGKTHSR